MAEMKEKQILSWGLWLVGIKTVVTHKRHLFVLTHSPGDRVLSLAWKIRRRERDAKAPGLSGPKRVC